MTAGSGSGRATLAAVGALALLVAVVLHLVTRGHLGVSSDGIVYLDAARSLADGHGFTTLSYGPGRAIITHFPPGYSAAVAMVGSALGVGMYRAAGLLSLVIAAAMVVSGGAIVLRWTGSRLAAVIAVGVLGLHPVLLDLYAMPRSEPLYLLALLWSLDSLARYLTDQRLAWLLLASVLAAAGTMTRFVGLALIGLIPLAVVVLGRAAGRVRITHAALALALALAPLALWVAHTSDVGAPRDLRWHPGPLFTEADELLLWTLAWPAPPLALLRPGPWLTFFKGLAPALLGAGAIAWVLVLRARGRATGWTPGGRFVPALLWAGHGVAYFAFVILSVMVADAATPLNDRILAPTFLSLTLAAVIGWPELRNTPGRATRVLRGAVALSLALVAAGGAVWIRGHLRHGGPGWDVGRYGRGPVLSAVARLPAEAKIYTTRPDVVYAATGRQAARLPGLFDPFSHRAIGLEARLDSLRATLCCGSVVVLFRSGRQGPYDPGLPRRSYDPADSVVQRLLGLTLARTDSFARLYVLPAPDTVTALPGRAARP